MYVGARVATSHAAHPIVPVGAVGGFFPTSPATRPTATNQDIKNYHQNTPRTGYRRNHENKHRRNSLVSVNSLSVLWSVWGENCSTPARCDSPDRNIWYVCVRKHANRQGFGATSTRGYFFEVERTRGVLSLKVC